MKKVAALVLAVFACAYTQVTLAGAIGPWIGGASTANSAGSLVYYANGSYSKAQAAMGVQSRWNPDVLATVGTGVSVTQKVALPVGAGVANTALSGLIKPLAVVATVGAILGSPAVAVVSSFVLIPGVLDWLLSADARPAPAGSAKQYEVKDASVGYFWQQPGQAYLTAQGACDAYTAYEIQRVGFSAAYLDRFSAVLNAQNVCTPTHNESGNTFNTAVITLQQSSGAWKPASYADFSQKLSGVPVTSALINALVDAGYTFPLDGPAVTGPASISGVPVVSTTRSTAANGDSITTTETTTPTSSIGYSTGTDPATGKPAASVTASTATTTTTNVFNNTTNTTVSNTTNSVNNPAKPTAPEADVSATDTALPGQPKLYKQKYPDGLSGVWKTQHELMVATPLFTAAKGLMPTVATSGACPTMPINLTFSSWANYGVKDVAPPCQVWDWGRAITIVGALLLARQLIFGG